jgi:tetratricopeptide (TPR) repeat protein
MRRHDSSLLRWVILVLSGVLSACAHQAENPSSAPSRLAAADAALERGLYPWAVREYRLEAAASGRSAIAERAARVAFDNGQDRELLTIATDWLAREPGSEAARRFRAIALLQLDRRSEAAREFGELVRTAYASPSAAFVALRESLADSSNEPGAAAVVGALARQYPDIPEAAYAHATLALSAGDSATALREVELALRLKPGWREVRWLQVRARIASGDCDTGLAAARGLAAEAGDADKLIHAWLLTACGDAAEARPLFEELSRGRLSAEALEGLASLDVDSRRFDEANRKYTQLAGTGHNTERAVFGLAIVADRRHDVERAARLYSRVTSGPRAVAAQLRAYRNMQEAGEPDSAMRMLDQVVMTQPELRVALTAGRAEVLAEMARIPEALALLQRATRMYPDRVELIYARAVVLERSGDVAGAIGLLRGVLKARPDDPVAQNALGFTLADHSQDLGRAEMLIRAALAQQPDSAAVRDSLGWVLYRKGDAGTAVGWLRGAYARDPDAEIAVHLATVEWSQGDSAGAAALIAAALERWPGDRRLEALRVRLGIAGQ